MAKPVSQNMLRLSPGDEHFLSLNGLKQAKWKSGSKSISVMLLPVGVIVVNHVFFICLFPQETNILTPARKQETSL